LIFCLSTARLLAGAAVIAIGAWMVLAADKDEDEKASRLTTSRGLALIALGISISLDELAIGFTIGLAIGARIGERWRERAEQVAGVALILLGVYLITEQLTQSARQRTRHRASRITPGRRMITGPLAGHNQGDEGAATATRGQPTWLVGGPSSADRLTSQADSASSIPVTRSLTPAP
jgi:uncharacterized membrane protein YfcA